MSINNCLFSLQGILERTTDHVTKKKIQIKWNVHNRPTLISDLLMEITAVLFKPK